jgi:hypothetical protein
MPDDGYGEFGGNGSVQCVIDIKNLKKKPTHTGATTGGAHRTEVVAENGSFENLKISLRIPKMMNEGQFRSFLAAAPVTGNKLEFSIPIEAKTTDQVKVSWG